MEADEDIKVAVAALSAVEVRAEEAKEGHPVTRGEGRQFLVQQVLVMLNQVVQ